MTLDQLLGSYRSASGIAPDGTSCYSSTPRLIRGETLSCQQQAIVEQLDVFLQQATPLTEELIVYRGCAPQHLCCLPNKPYPSFMSASKALAEALRFVDGCLVRIRCPVGSRVLNVSPNNQTTATLEREEVLLARNSQFDMEEWDFWSTASDCDKLLVQGYNISDFEALTLKLK